MAGSNGQSCVTAGESGEVLDRWQIDGDEGLIGGKFEILPNGATTFLVPGHGLDSMPRSARRASR